MTSSCPKTANQTLSGLLSYHITSCANPVLRHLSGLFLFSFAYWAFSPSHVSAKPATPMTSTPAASEKSGSFLGGEAGQHLIERIAGWSLDDKELAAASWVAQAADPKDPDQKKKKKLQVLVKRPFKKQEKDPNRLEIGGLPAVNFNVDTGFGVGVILNLARFAPGYYPYKWRLFLQIYLTLRPDGAGGVEVPFQSHFLELDLPDITKGVRLRARVEFRRFSTAGYYGLGNDSPVERPWDSINADNFPDEYRAARRFQQYDRIYPFASLGARIDLWERDRKRLQLFLTGDVTYNIITPYVGSKLERDIRESQTSTATGLALRDVLKGTGDHAMLVASAGILWDSRDHEFTPKNGMLHEISFRGSPGVDARLAFGAVNATLRFYQSIYKEYLVLAVRFIGDIMFGAVPFYLMAEHGGFFPANSFGSGTGMRAIPTGRFHGKIKALGNIELRSKFWTFSIGTVPFSLGALAFFDFGRAWLDFSQTAALFDGLATDANLYGFKIAGGGGLRIQWGESLVVRLDVGYSNISELGFYLDINHIF